jgi:hypothetical protein
MLRGTGWSGVVLGNGPQLDRLPPKFWRALEQAPAVVCGVNRVCVSRRLRELDYAPALHLIVDAPPLPLPAFHAALRSGLQRLAGRTWRVSFAAGNAAALPADQFVAPARDWTGDLETEGVKLRFSSADAAVNLLYRLGLRRVCLVAVELNDGRHCAIEGAIEPASRWERPAALAAALAAWRDVVRSLPRLALNCAAPHSRLVREGVAPFGPPEGLDCSLLEPEVRP